MTTNETTYDFGDGRGPVPAKRHMNYGKLIGGWVSDCSTVSSDCFLCPGSVVFDRSIVSRHCHITRSVISAQSVVTAHAMLEDSVIRSHSSVYYSRIDKSHITGGAVVAGGSRVLDHSVVEASVVIGSRVEFGSRVISGSLVMDQSIITQGSLLRGSRVTDGGTTSAEMLIRQTRI